MNYIWKKKRDKKKHHWIGEKITSIAVNTIQIFWKSLNCKWKYIEMTVTSLLVNTSNTIVITTKSIMIENHRDDNKSFTTFIHSHQKKEYWKHEWKIRHLLSKHLNTIVIRNVNVIKKRQIVTDCDAYNNAYFKNVHVYFKIWLMDRATVTFITVHSKNYIENFLRRKYSLHCNPKNSQHKTNTIRIVKQKQRYRRRQRKRV